MSFVKINADNLILDYHIANNDVYTLVCRSDISKPNSWNLIPSIDFVRFDNPLAERQLYITAIHQVQRLQEIKYPKVNKIKEILQSEIDNFHKTIDIMYRTEKIK